MNCSRAISFRVDRAVAETAESCDGSPERAGRLPPNVLFKSKLSVNAAVFVSKGMLLKHKQDPIEQKKKQKQEQDHEQEQEHFFREAFTVIKNVLVKLLMSVKFLSSV